MSQKEAHRFRLIRAERGGNHVIVFDECTPTGAWEIHSLEAKEEARAEFYDAMADLVPAIVDIQSWPASYAEGIELCAVHYRRSEYGVLSGVYLEAVRVTVDWPDWKFRSVTIPGPSLYRDYQPIVDQLEALQGCALRYVNEMRAQGNLFDASFPIPQAKEA